MNVLIRFFALVLIAAVCAACSPMIGQPGHGDYPVYHSRPNNTETCYEAVAQNGRWAVDMAVPAYAGVACLNGNTWRVNGKAVPSRLMSVANDPREFRGRPQHFAAPVAATIAPFPGMSASLATLILADVDKGVDPCAPSTQRSGVTAFSFITGLATFALTGDAGVGLGVGLLSSLGASNSSQWNCSLHQRFRWSLLATIDAGKPRCLETLSQRQSNGRLDETLTRDCAAVEQKNFRRIP